MREKKTEREPRGSKHIYNKEHIYDKKAHILQEKSKSLTMGRAIIERIRKTKGRRISRKDAKKRKNEC